MPIVLSSSTSRRRAGELTDELLGQLRTLGLESLASWAQPIRELRFDDRRRWRLDLAWPTLELAVELEGGTYVRGGGRHQRARGFRDDCDKYNRLELEGWTLLRFTRDHVDDWTAAQLVDETIRKRAAARG